MAAKKRAAGSKPAAGKKKEKTYSKDTKSRDKGQGADFIDVEFEVITADTGSKPEEQKRIEKKEEPEPAEEWREKYRPIAELTDAEMEAFRKKNKEELEAAGEDADAFQKIITDVENLTDIEYQLKRKEIAKKYAVRVGWIDTLYAQLHRNNGDGQASGSGIAIVFEQPQPWPEKVNGSALLTEISDTIKRFLILPDEGANIMSLYAIFTYIFQDFGICPLLIFLSAIMRCAKTLAETLMSLLCNRSIAVSNISESVLYRSITKFEPTLILDELDALFGPKKSDKSEATRALLNSGQTLPTAFVLRCNPQTFEPEMFSTYCPKICAAIGTLPATIMDRGFVLHLERKKTSEAVERFSKVKPDPVFKELRSKIQRWVNDNREQIKTIEPSLPPGLSDREVDNFEPLFSVAQIAGPEWVSRINKAALFLSAKSAEEGEAAIMLLEDVHNYFSNYKTDRVSSKDLSDYLGELEVRPWPEWRKDKPITPRQIARILKPFNISPDTMRIGGMSAKGYDRKNFVDAWDRYIIGNKVTEDSNSIQDKEIKCYGNVTVTDKKSNKSNDVTDSKSNSNIRVTPGEQVNSIQDKDLENQGKKCYSVTDKNTLPGGIKV